MKAEITEQGIEINGTLINEIIFQEEKCDWTLREREDEIDNLIDWISESQKYGDKALMKADLKYLISLDDEYIFSNISTNRYIANSDNEIEFHNICMEILELNEKENQEIIAFDGRRFKRKGTK